MRISIPKLIGLLADYSGVTVSELLGDDRTKYTVIARHAVMIVLRERVGLTYPHIAKIMGDRDHATAMYAIKKSRSEALLRLIEEINHELDEYAAAGGEYTPKESTQADVDKLMGAD